MFDNADEALASNERAADWVRHKVLEFARGMPEAKAKAEGRYKDRPPSIDSA